MSKGRKWYKKEEYNQPREPFDPGDGSLIAVDKDPDELHPTALKITRVWADGHVTTVRKVPSTKFSQALYLEIEGDRVIVPTEPKKAEAFSESLSNGTYRPPYLSMSSVPGNKPGDDYDPATDQYFSTRAKFSEYYKTHHLEKVGPSEIGNMKLGAGAGGPYTGSAQQFDPAKGPPVPPEFAGVKFHYGE